MYASFRNHVHLNVSPTKWRLNNFTVCFFFSIILRASACIFIELIAKFTIYDSMTEWKSPTKSIVNTRINELIALDEVNAVVVMLKPIPLCVYVLFLICFYPIHSCRRRPTYVYRHGWLCSWWNTQHIIWFHWHNRLIERSRADI